MPLGSSIDGRVCIALIKATAAKLYSFSAGTLRKNLFSLDLFDPANAIRSFRRFLIYILQIFPHIRFLQIILTLLSRERWLG